MIRITDRDIYFARARRVLIDLWLLALHVATQGWDMIDEHFLDGIATAWLGAACVLGLS